MPDPTVPRLQGSGTNQIKKGEETKRETHTVSQATTSNFTGVKFAKTETPRTAQSPLFAK